MRQLATALLAAGAAGHGWINEPPSRTGATLESSGTCTYGSCLWFSQGCTIGCPKCLGAASSSGTCGSQQGKATIPHRARTYNLGRACGNNPWCAPGSAPIMNPCGVAGGDTQRGMPGNGGEPPPGYQQGTNGTDMPKLPGARWKRTYKAGHVVDMAWGVVANHGGGYQYRLCPKSSAQTEECFQKTPLEFHGNKQYIQYAIADQYPEDILGNDTPTSFPPERAFPTPVDLKNRTAIPATDVSTGTIPAGSTWRRNPIPACNAEDAGAFNYRCGSGGGTKSSDFQFPPPGPDGNRPGFLLGGFGGGSCGGCGGTMCGGYRTEPCGGYTPEGIPSFCRKDGPNGPDGGDGPANCTLQQENDHYFTFSVVDRVKIPKVPPGAYVVSFRWDCEQTPQIWASCSDVTIE